MAKGSEEAKEKFLTRVASRSICYKALPCLSTLLKVVLRPNMAVMVAI